LLVVELRGDIDHRDLVLQAVSLEFAVVVVNVRVQLLGIRQENMDSFA
jgi:hypothetical protein